MPIFMLHRMGTRRLSRSFWTTEGIILLLTRTLLFTKASELGQLALVKLFLRDRRVDPTNGQYSALQITSAKGHTAIFELLFADPRVNSAAGKNTSTRFASKFGHVDVARLLLADRRIKLESVMNAKALGLGTLIKWIQAARNGEGQFLPSLMSHPDLDIVISNCKCGSTAESALKDIQMKLFKNCLSFQIEYEEEDQNRVKHKAIILTSLLDVPSSIATLGAFKETVWPVLEKKVFPFMRDLDLMPTSKFDLIAEAMYKMNLDEQQSKILHELISKLI